MVSTTATTTTPTALPIAGPSRSRGPDNWHPTRYLEPNHPDNEEVQEQAAYQAAVTRQGGDDRKRKIKPRRAVDYQGSVQKWRMLTKMKGVNEYRPAIHPNQSDIVNLLPAAALRLNPSTSICDQWVHTSINKERSPTRVVRWTPDARRLLTGNDKGQFTLWNGASFNYESITQVHDDSIRSFTYSHNGQALVSTDKIGTIKYFTPHLTNIHGFQGHREACHDVSWSPNDERFVSGGDDGLVKIWSYREAREEKVLSGHGWDVRCVDWHPTKGLIVSGSKDMLVKFWDPRTGKDLSTLHSHKSTINTCSWSPEGHLVATAGGDAVIRLFDIRTFRELEAMKGHTKEINCLEWHPIHHSLFSSGDSAGTINHYSLTSPTPSEPITSLTAAHEDAVFSLSYHPLGHLLCSGSKDFTARFWQRARPAGGHEKDRWHLGEQGALGAKMDMESGSGWGDKAGLNISSQGQGPGPGQGQSSISTMKKEEEIGLPGLSNLVAAVNAKVGLNPTNGFGSTIESSTGLPGLGAYTNNRESATTTNPLPPLPSREGRDGFSGPGGSGMRARAPLPSQGDMLRQNTSGPGPGSQSQNGFNERERDGGNSGRRGGGGGGRFGGGNGDRPPRNSGFDGPPGGNNGRGGYGGRENRYNSGQNGGRGGGGFDGQQHDGGGRGGYGTPQGFGGQSGYAPPGGNGYNQSQGGYAPPLGFGGPPAQGQGQGQGFGAPPPPPQQGPGYSVPPPQGYPPQNQYGQGGPAGGNGGYGGGNGWR
ncbi:uncharacterized protein IL334_002550 [Kwoniella shivajii]|uniref:Polyadenylation factor subunit 2 n=1 Tax=Kwoniella shivajii TaxID=564305 RepID=A0ABZ1CV15_9TREE|nr:hypothetical protein IL334_002550 [Kwoniella shivajii]